MKILYEFMIVILIYYYPPGDKFVENLSGGTSVVTLRATDGDSGINGRLSYSILYNTSNLDGYLYFDVS